jgi:hypothetical protein
VPVSGSALLDAPPREALDLREGISLLEAAQTPAITKPDGTVIELGYDSSGSPTPGGVFDDQGRVPLHIIRPGIGKGRGRHLYEAQMLQENADVFSGWRMFLNHQSPEAKRAAGGLPRDVRDLGGRVQEAWWDPTVPADEASGHDQGAVVGMVRPVKLIRELIDDDPGLIEASISATASAVRPVVRGGQRVWLVEGINARGSVDWVTEAGAGGRIAPMLEEAYSEEEEVQMALLESMTDEELVARLKESRPGLLQEAMKDDGDAEDKKDGGDDELAEKTAELMKKGMPKAMAEKAARKALSESTDGDPEGGEVAEITPEALKEALSASPNVLVEALTESGEAQVFIASLVEAKLDEERETIREEARADVDRAFELASFERTAHAMISESRLPESWQNGLKEKFSLVENKPTDALDVVADVDDDGKVEKAAITKLRESVEAEITKERERLREASPTRVRSTTATLVEAAKKDGDDDEDKGKIEEAKKGDQPYWATILSEAGVQDPDKAYAPLEG